MRRIVSALSSAGSSILLGFVLMLIQLPSPALAELQESKLEDVTVAYSNPGISTLPINIGQEKGFFAAEKLHVNLVLMQTFVAGRAVIGGDVDYNSLAGNMITLAAGAPRSKSSMS
jgi:ABC-type nitrate/sulfonate/bicarbonate transport system substrate-binding protein